MFEWGISQMVGISMTAWAVSTLKSWPGWLPAIMRIWGSHMMAMPTASCWWMRSEVYLECLREGGVLERCRDEPPGGFRPFLLAVVRNIARRVEERRAGRRERQLTTEFQRDGGVDEDADPAHKFDCTWAVTIVRNARRRVEERLGQGSPAAQRRVELLRLRYQEGLPVKEIAPQIGEDSRRVHHQLEEARRDFHRALREEVAFHLPGSAEEVEQECRLLLGLLAGDDSESEASEF